MSNNEEEVLTRIINNINNIRGQLQSQKGVILMKHFMSKTKRSVLAFEEEDGKPFKTPEKDGYSWI